MFFSKTSFEFKTITINLNTPKIEKRGTLPETNELPLKINGWKTIHSFCESSVSGAKR